MVVSLLYYKINRMLCWILVAEDKSPVDRVQTEAAANPSDVQMKESN